MRNHLIVLAIIAVVVAGGVAVASSPAAGTDAPVVINLLKNGSPTAVGGYEIPLGTVPDGETWTVTHVLVLAEKHSGGLPVGGEFTVSLFENGQPFAESSTATDSRTNYQGEGYVGAKFPPGTELSVFVWLRGGITDFSDYFWGISALVQQEPL